MPPAGDAVWDLRRHANAAPQRVAIACGEERLTYGELEALANRIAAVLRHLGLTRGDHVASLIGNRPEALAIPWAAWRSGLYLTPISTALTLSEVRYLVEDCDARAVIVDAALRDVAALLPSVLPTPLRWLSVRGPIPGFTPLEPLLAEASPAPQTDEPPGALMMYTSGHDRCPEGRDPPAAAGRLARHAAVRGRCHRPLRSRR